MNGDWLRSLPIQIEFRVVGDNAIFFIEGELLETTVPSHCLRFARGRPSTSNGIALRIDWVDLVGLTSAAVHDVPNWWRGELGRAVGDISDLSSVSIPTAECISAIVGEGDSAATAVGVIETADAANIDLEGVTSKTEVRVLKKEYKNEFKMNYLLELIVGESSIFVTMYEAGTFPIPEMLSLPMVATVLASM